MDTLLGLPEFRQSEPLLPGTDPTIAGQVVNLLTLAYPPTRVERRREQRFPYPHIVYMTECTEDGTPVAVVAKPAINDLLPIAAEAPNNVGCAPGRIIAVVGKHLSRSGFGFFHKEPIPNRLMIASFEGRPKQWTAFLIDLTWCRFNGNGWYDSGGRFLKIVPSPLNSD